jgi:hypothetical protein
MAVLYLLDGGSLLGQDKTVQTKGEPAAAAAETFDAGSRTKEATTQTRLPLAEELEPVHAGPAKLESAETARRFRALRPKTSRAVVGHDDGRQSTDDD